jgi:hypothetical protein
MTMRSYSPDSIILVAFGVRITGFADGTFVKVSRSSPAVTKHTGADGKTTRVISLDDSGEVTFTLAQSSPANDVLSNAFLNRKNGLGVRPFLLEDLNGSTKIHAENAWVAEPPEGEFGKELSNREWKLGLDAIDMFWGQTDLG